MDTYNYNPESFDPDRYNDADDGYGRGTDCDGERRPRRQRPHIVNEVDIPPSTNRRGAERRISDALARGTRTTRTPRDTQVSEGPRPRKRKESVPARTRKPLSSWSVAKFLSDRRLHGVIGLALILFAIYITVSGVSFIHNVATDQSAASNLTVYEMAHEAAAGTATVSNIGGPAGAKMSHALFTESFGIGTVVIIVYLVLLGLSLLRLYKANFWSLTFKSLIDTVTLSLVAGLLTYPAELAWPVGGYHGRYVNQWLMEHTGVIGDILVNVMLVAIVIFIYLNELRLVIKKYNEIKEHRRLLAEQRRAEELERQERLRRDLNDKVMGSNSVDDEDDEPEDDGRDRHVEFDPSVNPTDDTYDTPMTPCDTYNSQSTDYDSYDSTAASRDPLFAGAGTEVPHVDRTQDTPIELDDTFDSNDPIASTYQPRESTAPTHTGTKSAAAHDVRSVPVVTTPASTSATATGSNGQMISQGETFEVAAQVIEQSGSTTVAAASEAYDPTAELSHYQFPSLDLLHDRPNKTDNVDLDEQEENKERITKTLSDYGIPIQRIRATVGPTVTLYEIVPAEGVRIAKIKRLEDDIALSLAALGIRIIAPIPGRGTIGIEVPNKDPQTVSIRTVLGSKAFRDTRCALPMAMGATISNEVYIADLAKMPHLLVAGATGQGKSVGLNTIIASLLYKLHPSRLKFVLVDPKSVEFSLYNKLERHYLAKLPDEEEAVVTNFDKVERTLNSLCIEMDNRYALLKDAGVRTLAEYNDRFVARRLNPEKGHRYLPYIVIVVDEFADLIMMSGKSVEMPIARIAQKARAVGMHMIIATQRPSTNVITGIIKANFPGRIAFRVSQGVDSKTILDRMGANQLIGRGDMLFSHNGSMDRVQCAFIDTDEVEAICEHIDSQAGFAHAYFLPEPTAEAGDMAALDSSGPVDPLFEEAAQFIVSAGDTASTSSLQRRYGIGYNRAGKLMDQMESAGIVGPASGSKPRQVLIDPMTLDQMLRSRNG